MFASRSIVAHLARGAVGLGALWVSVVWSETQPWLLFVSLPLGLVALRGCPMCWTLGLFQTVAAKLRGKQVERACVDGRCAPRAK